MTDSPPGRIAYVLKGYPRISELFIASEIYRVEQAGLPLDLFVIKPRDEPHQHEVVDRIQAEPEYLAEFSSVSGVSFVSWLRRNLALAAPLLIAQLRRHPRAFVRSACAALAQAMRARARRWSFPRKLYLKEFFQAVALAEAIERKPGVRQLHAHFCHGATTVTWLASLLTGLPFSFTAHAKDIYSAKLNPSGLLSRKLRSARFAVTCTEANRKHLLALAPGAEVHRVYHGVNADFEGLIEAEAPSLPKRFQILGVGRLVPKKGFDTLTEACALLAKGDVTFRLSFIGDDGEARPGLERLLKDLHIEEHAEFLGVALQRDLYRAMRESSVLVLPCRILDNGDRDGIPNVLVEAMSCGLPVISTPISGIPELVVDGANGMLVPPDDPAALSEALARLHSEPGLAARLAHEARKTVRERFSAKLETARLVDLFERSLAETD